MTDPHYIPLKQFYDKLDEKYHHSAITGRLSRRLDGKEIYGDSLRVMIRGQRKHISVKKFIYWLYTDQIITHRRLIFLDGDDSNLRFENIGLAPNLTEALAERRQIWLDWVYMSEEEKLEYLEHNPEPKPPC